MERPRRLSAARATEIRRRISRPPAHWSLLAFVACVLLLLLLVYGLAGESVGHSGTPVGNENSPLTGSQPLLTAQGGQLRSRKLPAKRVALTFDDGPDPVWTRRIARELRRLRAPATFFVIGSQVVRHPEVVRELWRQGFELGNHTFTHADVFGMPGPLRRLQIDATDNAIAGATGIRARLFRPPYSSVPEAITGPEESVLTGIARDGYVVVLSDRDGQDWHPSRSPATIARSAVGRARGASVILLHDGGGDRARTLAALPRIVRRLRAEGYRLVEVSRLLGLRRSAVDFPTTGWQRLRGRLLIASLTAARWITAALTLMLAPIALLILLRAAFVVALAHRHARRRRALPTGTSQPPSVSIVVPAFNEAVVIERAVRSFAASDYPELEVIVVDDGSEDGTGDVVEAVGLEQVQVIRQRNSGKSAALNRGIAASRNEVIVMVDADTVFETASLRRVVAPLSASEVGAVSGNTKVGNRRGLLGRWQHIEYVLGFNLDRRLFDVLRCLPTVPGAIGAFRRDALADVGEVPADTLAEDTDLTLAIGRAGWEVVYAEEARAWTEAPATLAALWRQRYRWSYGTMQAIWKHKAAIWRRGERRIGRRAIPYLVLFQILLPALAPLVDVFALYGAMFLDPAPVLGYWLAFNLVQLAQGWYAFRLDGESPRPLWAVPLQQFVYRQLMYLVVIESMISALRGTRLRWQHAERSGEIEVSG
ncbi:MAG TPA: bifunctional polysaccharide deacetylase/glycosyltransferase family 2 protein [Thermoleophilaceae bacterium]|nr:bifunctional polysaccharide deacetylase/glycosyltransferase family 2 protein [Thermoleophilaceae bacterium]